MKKIRLYNIGRNLFYLAVLLFLLVVQIAEAADATYNLDEANEINANTAAIDLLNKPKTEIGSVRHIVDGEVAIEKGERVANDNALQLNITAEANARIAADTTLQTNINNEAAARQAADGDLSDLTTTEKSNLVGAINEVHAASAMNSATNQRLESRINTNSSHISRNTRGIAMVAALTHTTILPGMTHALDISAAHFEDETGMSLSYSRRVSEGVQVNFGAASTTDFEEAVVRAGIGFQW